MSERPTDTINAVIAEIGLSTPVTNADWGRMFADALMGAGDEDAIRYALSDAGEKYRSQALSRTRKAARKAVDRTMRRNRPDNADELAAIKQLAFEVAFEGVAPRPLIQCDYAFLVEAEAYMERLYQGTQENLHFIRHAIDVTAPHPGRLIEDLIADGLLSANDFGMEEAA